VSNLSNLTNINRSSAWPVLVGPVALGAALGFSQGVLTMLTNALALPTLVLGLALTMTPALYIGLSLTGGAPKAAEVAHATLSALRSSGLVMAGFAPATLFIVASTHVEHQANLVATVVVGTAVVLGLRCLSDLLFSRQRSARHVVVYGAWAVIGLALGADLLNTVLNGGALR
jgi:hypothetical protein